ncbi:hypothetical protein H5410_035753 [Solanum commersonii]|uniref:Uncharacterized protein n=1 Tax=Solanum commersonii TaxID=4109 RepID=A0A9J5Y266_SOLCO|nr:hypothetical protein H5410_035753 [Solanum commersonii]
MPTLVTMSSSERPDKAVATSRQREFAQSEGNFLPAHTVPKGQTRQFGVKVVTKEGKAWWKKYTEASYFSDVCIDRDSLEREFPQILRVCLVYALMTATELNIEVVLKSAMRKAWVHKGHKYGFGGLITRMCRAASVPEENVDYMAPLFLGPDVWPRDAAPLEWLSGFHWHVVGDVERRYPLNAHAKALLDIGPEFREPIDNDILADEEGLRTSSDIESNSDEEVDPA